MDLGLAWPLSTQTGWGQVGFNMALQMLRLGKTRQTGFIIDTNIGQVMA